MLQQCSSPFYETAQYLHIAYTCIQATIGYAYISLHACGFSVVLGAWQIQVLLFGTFWDSHPRPPIFSIHSSLNPQMQNPWIWTANCTISLLLRASARHHLTSPVPCKWPSALLLGSLGSPLWSTISQLSPSPHFC